MFLGATPDMLIECKCRDVGVVDVKCPWKVKDTNLSHLLNDAKRCVRESDGALEIKTTHRYYYQVQAQMFVWKTDYADFILWNME